MRDAASNATPSTYLEKDPTGISSDTENRLQNPLDSMGMRRHSVDKYQNWLLTPNSKNAVEVASC